MKDLRDEYTNRRKNHLISMAEKLRENISENINKCKRVDSVSVRAKDVDRFCRKAKKKDGSKFKYSDPINQIQDQIAGRIVVKYPSDIEKVSSSIEKYYRPIERQKVIPDADDKFGYEGKHYILFIPEHILPVVNKRDFPKVFELQIKTLFQHAWSEAEHDLAYKAKKDLSSEVKRKVAFTAAQAWGADQIFQDLFDKFGEM